jgi:hypothetical protein
MSGVVLSTWAAVWLSGLSFILAPSLPHFTRSFKVTSAKTRLKSPRGGVLVGPTLTLWGADGPSLSTSSFPTSHKLHRPTSSLSITPRFFAVSHFLHQRRHGLSRVTTSMPRRKASERDQPHRRRSRNGCLNCRRRKIRCDEEAPSCGYCIARGLTCSRGGVVLKWEAEYADNGLAFGRQGVGPAAGLQG